MTYYITSDENNLRICLLTSCQIETIEDVVIVKVQSKDQGVSYMLRPDTRFETVDIIRNFLEKLFTEVISNGYILKITEDLERNYLYFGYETENNCNSGQFTGSKL